MCTVTLFPVGKSDFVLTSNRDESPKRATLAPNFYMYKNNKLLYPKDEKAGGSWIGVSENQRVICVLNGAFTLHTRKEAYRLSRGVVMKDLLIANDIISAIKLYDLNEIEPFTMVIVDWSTSLRFIELIWDGEKKHLNEMPLSPKIWSSSTLYSNEMKKERKEWFNDFKQDQELDADSIIRFHKTAGCENLEYGVIMDRFFVKTTSITQIKKKENEVLMIFENLDNSVVTSTPLKMRLPINE